MAGARSWPAQRPYLLVQLKCISILIESKLLISTCTPPALLHIIQLSFSRSPPGLLQLPSRSPPSMHQVSSRSYSALLNLSSKYRPGNLQVSFSCPPNILQVCSSSILSFLKVSSRFPLSILQLTSICHLALHLLSSSSPPAHLHNPLDHLHPSSSFSPALLHLSSGSLPSQSVPSWLEPNNLS